MNTPHPPEASERANKLIIRSEVLAVIRHLASLPDPPKQERFKQLKRLQELGKTEDVLDILVKELRRSSSAEVLIIVTELLMELGSLEYLQEPLWNVIRDPNTGDEIKDASNLVLRHLGDNTDPNLYLEYLQDPQGLIGRETTRMLEISTENPEALIDFLDFIVSLGLEDQTRLLSALQRDYPSEYLVNIFVPLLESDPSPELWEQLVEYLGESRSPQAAECLHHLATWPEDRLPIPHKQITKALKQLQLAGAYRPIQLVEPEPPTPSEEPEPIHPMARDTVPYHCYATLSDGIGNQGILFSRQRPNGDISMISVAINDVHGIIDCFGFFQLSVGDFHKITEKFHEGSTKIKVTAEYCAYKLVQAEAINHRMAFRMPYEFRCWRPLMDGIDTSQPPEWDEIKNWVRKEWYTETNNLYQHPDFHSWFLEQGDEPAVTRMLQRAILITEDFLQDADPDMESYAVKLEEIADRMVQSLLDTPWRDLLINRLKEAAYLLHCQNTHTFRNLAATEALKLETLKTPEELVTGFTQAYGRRCISEELLRLRTGHPEYDRLTDLIDFVFPRWGF